VLGYDNTLMADDDICMEADEAEHLSRYDKKLEGDNYSRLGGFSGYISHRVTDGCFRYLKSFSNEIQLLRLLFRAAACNRLELSPEIRSRAIT
jgi:hypothetical protein